jgi:hypothetical protein
MDNALTADQQVGEVSRHSLTLAYPISVLIALLMAAASIAGLLDPDRLYPTDAQRQAALANDVANLVVGLPFLVASLWLSWRGRLVGTLFWPGALMYILYNYLVYAFLMPVSWFYLFYLALIALTTYTLIGVVASIDGEAVKRRLAGVVPERLSAMILIALGAFSFVRVFGVIIAAMIQRSELPMQDLAVMVSDVSLSPAWIIGGVLLWRRRELGYVAGLGLLFQACMLFVGLILVLALQPVLMGATFPWSDIIVVAILGSFCFVPTVLFLRGVLKGR